MNSAPLTSTSDLDKIDVRIGTILALDCNEARDAL